jgi:hypothetical protein
VATGGQITELHTLTTVADDPEGTLTYTVFDRTGGEVVREVFVPVPNTSVNVSYLWQSDLPHVRSPGPLRRPSPIACDPAYRTFSDGIDDGLGQDSERACR